MRLKQSTKQPNKQQMNFMFDCVEERKAIPDIIFQMNFFAFKIIGAMLDHSTNVSQM